MSKKLSFNQLKKTFSPNDYNFLYDEIDSTINLTTQERAYKSLEFGLNIKNKGYNIFVCGDEGLGTTELSLKITQNIAKHDPVPNDICYVYNFQNPKESKVLFLDAGLGTIFKNEMDELTATLLNELPKAFSSKEFEAKKTKILKKYQEERDKIVKLITEKAKEKEFGIKTTASGMYFMPIINDELISEEQYEALDQDSKDAISAISDEIQTEASETMRLIKDLEKIIKNKLSELEYSESLFVVGYYIGFLIEKYSNNKEILHYLQNVKEDILDNIDSFVEDESTEEVAYTMLPWYTKKSGDEIFYKYRVNVLVDNKDLSGAPIIIDYNPTYTNLIGEIEYDSEFGNLSTDFLKIKPGVLHKANGGYLILKAVDVLSNIHVWGTLKRVLTTSELSIEPIKEYSTGLVVSYIKPEPIKLDVKIIIIGTSDIYEILEYYDDDFKKLFKIRADFDDELPACDKNIKELFKFIKNFIDTEKTLSFSIEAVLKILEYSQRFVGSQEKITANFEQISEILIESVAWAKRTNKNIVELQDVGKTLSERYYRMSMYEERLNDLLDKEIIMIETAGQKVGQINALTVISTGDYEFGKPVKITATTSVGKTGVINIEKEVKMSGRIHDKGVQVISGFLEQTYAQEFPMALSCRICFEQSYSHIDGDSASSTELYAILSSLASVPINQEIAVTGSTNQFGEIQPIGGVTYKIEGFFDLCKKRGLTGTQGVIIPTQNISDLVLKDEVIFAVKDGLFHIYHISHINEGIEILTGIPAGTLDEKNKYSANSIHGKVYKKLKCFHKASV